MLKTYKKTILWSAAGTALCVLTSVILECIDGLPKYCVAIENYAIGIACSLLVVIITTYISFRAEQKKLFNQIESSVESIVYIIHFCMATGLSENSADYKKAKEIVTNQFTEYLSAASQLCWICNKNKEKLDELNQALLPLSNEFTREMVTNEMKPLNQMATGIQLIGILEKTDSFCDEYTKKRKTELITAIKRCMENKELNYN